MWSVAVGIAAISVIYLIGMSAMSGITDYLSYYMAMMKFMLIYYIAVYLVLMVVYSFILVRPSFAFSAFYDTLFCREWPERESEPADPFENKICAACGKVPADGWIAIKENSAAEITAAGHYYLDKDWSKSSKAGVTMPNFNICLDLKSKYFTMLSLIERYVAISAQDLFSM